MAIKEKYGPVSLKDINFFFSLDDRLPKNSSNAVCMIPELFADINQNALLEILAPLKTRRLILITDKPEWTNGFAELPFPVSATGSVMDLLRADEHESLIDLTLDILDRLNRKEHNSIETLCQVISRLTGSGIFFLFSDMKTFIDCRSEKKSIIPFHDWADALSSQENRTTRKQKESLFRNKLNSWYGSLLKVHNRTLGYIFYKKKQGGFSLSLSHRSIINMYLMMAGTGEVYKHVQQKKQKDEFLYSVVYGLNRDRKLLKDEAAALNIPFEKLRYIWILRPAKKEGRENFTGNTNDIMTICETTMPENIFLRDGDNIVSIHEKNSESDEAAAARMQTLMKKIESEYPDLRCTIGNSRAYPDLAGLHHAYTDAKFSLRIGDMIYGNTRNFVTYNDLLIYHFLFDQKENPIIRRLYTNSIETLLQYDREKKEHLLETIRVLILNEFGISETARHLGLHRNTLYQRMDKIETLTGINLKSHEGRLLLQLGIKLDLIIETGMSSD